MSTLTPLIVGTGLTTVVTIDAALLLVLLSGVEVVAVADNVRVAAANGQTIITLTEIAAISLTGIDAFAHDTVPFPPVAGFAHVHPAGAVTDMKTVCAGMMCVTTVLFAAATPRFVTVNA